MHSQGAVWWQGDLCQATGVSERSWEALSCQPVLPVAQLVRGSWLSVRREAVRHKANKPVVPVCPGISAPGPVLLGEDVFYFSMTI